MNDDIQSLLHGDTFNELDHLWQLFHENSKVTSHFFMASDESIVARTREIHAVLPYENAATIPLPSEMSRSKLSFDEAVLSRVTERSVRPCKLSLTELSTILHYAYGVTRDNADTMYPRAFRTVPSGGALYPLEIYCHCTGVEGLDSGLYHYHPIQKAVQLLRAGDLRGEIAGTLVPRISHLAEDTSVMIFITALFQRTMFKYGPRGYRFVFLEAGHVAQNINLTATALQYGSVNICGYYDHKVDRFLNLDGLLHSTIYMVGIGAPGE
jgi:SagB-type dehydrogenase family enzyme